MGLEALIHERKAKIGVVGLGYVGLPLAVEFANRGFSTVGIEIQPEKVAALKAGKNYIGDVDNEMLRRMVAAGLLTATTEYDAVAQLDVIFICVPTPVTPSKDPDISFILDAAKRIRNCLRLGQLVIVRSTTFPGTTEDHVLPILEESGLHAGEDFNLAFSPERTDPGNRQFTTANTPVVVGGVTPRCTELASQILRVVTSAVIPVSSPKVAEMEKLLENIFRSVNIALVNELAQLCDRMGGISIWEVVRAAATKPFGFMPFYPGPGIGGHCILVDPYYLSWLARQHDFHTNFITLAAETNESMPYYVANMILREMSKLPQPLPEAKFLILGVAFKKDVDDTRHSPALKIMGLLRLEGARHISFHDPHVHEVAVDGKPYRSVELSAELLAGTDCVVIATNHSAYNYDFIVAHTRGIVIDTRNATAGVREQREKIIVLGNGGGMTQCGCDRPVADSSVRPESRTGARASSPRA